MRGMRCCRAAEASAHECLALIAFEALGFRIGIAGSHFLLLSLLMRRFTFQARAHERLAFIAGLAGRLFVAVTHALLLRRQWLVSGLCGGKCQADAQRGRDQKLCVNGHVSYLVGVDRNPLEPDLRSLRFACCLGCSAPPFGALRCA